MYLLREINYRVNIWEKNTIFNALAFIYFSGLAASLVSDGVLIGTGSVAVGIAGNIGGGYLGSMIGGYSMGFLFDLNN